jgi:hypothetical protein
MADTPRITVQEVLEAKKRNPDLPIVCAYDDEEKCERLRLDGALTLGEFKARLYEFPKTTPIVFYCA